MQGHLCSRLADPRPSRSLQVGRQEAVMVLRVDKDKGYIDLSKRWGLGCCMAECCRVATVHGWKGTADQLLINTHRRVSPEDAERCDDRFQKSKMVRQGCWRCSKLCVSALPVPRVAARPQCM